MILSGENPRTASRSPTHTAPSAASFCSVTRYRIFARTGSAASAKKARNRLQAALSESYDRAPIILSDEVRELIRQLTEQADIPIPVGIQATLRPYQERGFSWMYRNFRIGFGSIIADDMGLGKTLQILYFMDWHSRKYPNHKPYLIVAPVSLLENWENEYYRFFMEPRLYVNRLTSKDVPRKFTRDIVDRMQKMDIMEKK